MNDAATTNTAVFTPQAVAAINHAYAEACKIIEGEGAREDLRFKLAERMMQLARAGETDGDRLCHLSVLQVIGRTPRR